MARLLPEIIAVGGANLLTITPKLTAILLASSQQAAAPGSGSAPTTGQLWPRGNS